MMDDGWWMTDDGWWVLDDGWCMMDNWQYFFILWSTFGVLLGYFWVPFGIFGGTLRVLFGTFCNYLVLFGTFGYCWVLWWYFLVLWGYFWFFDRYSLSPKRVSPGDQLGCKKKLSRFHIDVILTKRKFILKQKITRQGASHLERFSYRKIHATWFFFLPLNLHILIHMKNIIKYFFLYFL